MTTRPSNPKPTPMVVADAVKIQPNLEDAKSVDDLKAKGKIIVFDGNNDVYENYFGQDGSWYFEGLGEGNVDTRTKVGTLKGKYKTGTAAQAVIAAWQA